MKFYFAVILNDFCETVSQLSWLERYTDNVEVGSSSLPETTKFHLWKKGGLAQLARAPALHAGGHRFDSDILHNFLMYIKNKSSLTY